MQSDEGQILGITREIQTDKENKPHGIKNKYSNVKDILITVNKNK